MPRNIHSRTAKPVLVKLTSRERNQLEKLAAEKNIPLTTLAYEVLSDWLNCHQISNKKNQLSAAEKSILEKNIKEMGGLVGLFKYVLELEEHIKEIDQEIGTIKKLKF